METVTRAARAAMAVRWIWLAAKLGNASGGHTPLHLAAMNGHAEDVTALLKHRADPNAQNKDGSTPLHLAAMNGHAEAVTALLNAGADPNAQNKDGSTPLHLAAKWNQHPEVITALLDAGAAANAQDADGKQPFDYAKGNRAIRGSTAYWRLNDARF